MNLPPYITSAELGEVEHIRHGFFTRHGGVSEGIFTSLNCGLSSGDNLQDVNTNRQRVREALGFNSLFTLKQVHSRHVVVIDENSDSHEVVEADGLVTRMRGVGLGALGADCAPVLFADGVARIVGSAHAGWQGALKGVTDCVIDRMCGMGANRKRIICSIGPSIQWSSYEVGAEFKERLISDSPIPVESFFRNDENDGSIYFNLPGYIRQRVISAGVEQVDVIDMDTYVDHNGFFSYRRSCHQREQGYGRQISVIGLDAAV